jgi:serine/threonine protein kinase
MIAQQTRPPPTLSKPGDWSAEFNDFIAKTLVKDPESRASATELLEVCL